MITGDEYSQEVSSSSGASGGPSVSRYESSRDFEGEGQEMEMGTSAKASSASRLRSMLPRCIPTSFADIKEILSSVTGHLREPVADAYTLELFMMHSGYYLTKEQCENLPDGLKKMLKDKYKNNDAALGTPNLFSVDPDTRYSRLGTEYAYTKAIEEIKKDYYGGTLPCLSGKGDFRLFCIRVAERTKELKGRHIQQALAVEKAKGEASGLTWEHEMSFKQQICPQLCQFSGGNSVLMMMRFYNAKKIRDAKLEILLTYTYQNDLASGMDPAAAEAKKEAAAKLVLEQFNTVKNTILGDAFDGNFLSLIMFPPKAVNEEGLQCVFQINDGEVFNKTELDHYLGIFDKFNLDAFVADPQMKSVLSRRLHNSVIELINACNRVSAVALQEMAAAQAIQDVDAEVAADSKSKNFSVTTKIDLYGAMVITECSTFLLCMTSHILVDFIDQIRRNNDFTPIFTDVTNLDAFITSRVGQNKLKIYGEDTGCRGVEFDDPRADPIRGLQEVIDLFEKFKEPESQDVLETPLARIKRGLTDINSRLRGGISSIGSAVAAISASSSSSSSFSSSSSNSNSNSSDIDDDALSELREVEDIIDTGEQEIDAELKANPCLRRTSFVSSKCPKEEVKKNIEIEGLTKVEGLLPTKNEVGEDSKYEKRREFIDIVRENKRLNYNNYSAFIPVLGNKKIRNEEEEQTPQNRQKTGGKSIRKTKNNKKNKRRQTKKKAKRRITKKRRMVKRHSKRQTNKKH